MRCYEIDKNNKINDENNDENNQINEINNKIKLIVRCTICYKKYELMIDENDYSDFRLGKEVKDCFGYLDERIREMFVIGVCSRCYSRIDEYVELFY